MQAHRGATAFEKGGAMDAPTELVSKDVALRVNDRLSAIYLWFISNISILWRY